MTAHELARRLLAGPDLMVTVRGYEGGENEIERVSPPANLLLDYWESPFIFGQHEYGEPDNEHRSVSAISIGASDE